MPPLPSAVKAGAQISDDSRHPVENGATGEFLSDTKRFPRHTRV